MPVPKAIELKEQLKQLLKQGFIRPSVSPRSVPTLFVKKDGTLHIYIDYCGLNQNMIKNKYPIPDINELLDLLHGSSICTKIDLMLGSYQIRTKEKDIHKIGFGSRYGNFELTIIPFGSASIVATINFHMTYIF